MVSVFFTMLGAIILALCAVPCFFKNRRVLAVSLAANVAVLLAGAVCLAVSLVLVGQVLNTTADDADFRAWAKDVFALWMRVSGIATLLFGATVLATALARHPWRVVRMLIAAAASLLLLLFGGAYAVVAETTVVDMTLPIYLWTAACAMLLTAGAAVDALFALRTPTEQPPKKQKKKKKRPRRKK